MSSSQPVINKLYQISEKTGEFFGNITASMLNATTSVTTVGMDVMKKGNEQFVEKVSPAYNNAKEQLGNKVSAVIPQKCKDYLSKKTTTTQTFDKETSTEDSQ